MGTSVRWHQHAPARPARAPDQGRVLHLVIWPGLRTRLPGGDPGRDAAGPRQAPAFGAPLPPGHGGREAFSPSAWPGVPSWSSGTSRTPSGECRARPRVAGLARAKIGRWVPAGESIHEVVLDGDRHGLGAALGAEFAQDAADVELDRRAAAH